VLYWKPYSPSLLPPAAYRPENINVFIIILPPSWFI